MLGLPAHESASLSFNFPFTTLLRSVGLRTGLEEWMRMRIRSHTEVCQRYISYSQPANQYRQRLSSSFLPRGKLSSQLTYLLLTDHIEKLKLGKT